MDSRVDALHYQCGQEATETARTSNTRGGRAREGGTELRRVRWPARGALRLLRGYKLLISPYFRGSCRFLPSCADYAAEAIATHGLIRGTWLAAARLARCQPLCAAGYDPVPPVLVEKDQSHARRIRKNPPVRDTCSATLSGSR